MFTISARGIYGLSALVELALVYKHASLQVKDISATHGIPRHYLEQILLILRKGDIVESFRGVKGGYVLAHRPSEINLLKVMSLLEGKLEILPDQRKNNSLHFFWNLLEDEIRTFLDRSLEDLLLEKQKQQEQITYSI